MVPWGNAHIRKGLKEDLPHHGRKPEAASRETGPM